MANHPLKILGFEPVKVSEELRLEPQATSETHRSEHGNVVKARTPIAATKNADLSPVAGPAADRSQARNGEKPLGQLHKGLRVRLANGAQAQVAYVDPNMRIVRVRTDEGRNITVRYKDLRGHS